MHRIYCLAFFSLIVLTLVSPASALAKLGVGVATGKIIIEEKLHPGTLYTLPPLTVLNTGDETATYALGISHLEKQAELIPQSSWFKYDPSTFELKPGGSQVVHITLTIPLKVEPGEYFAYLESHPVQVTGSGQTTVGIAAAAKLSFTVTPANLFMGLYYRLLTLFRLYYPYDAIVLGLVALIVLILIFRSHFNFQITKKNE